MVEDDRRDRRRRRSRRRPRSPRPSGTRRSTRRSRRSTSAARSTRAAAPTPAGSRWRPARSRTTAARPTSRPATSSASRPAGATASNHTSPFNGVLATLDLNDLKSRFPAAAGAFNGPEPIPAPPNFNSRPNQEPFGFVVRVVVDQRPGTDDADRPGPPQLLPPPRPGHAARLPEARCRATASPRRCWWTSTATTTTSWSSRPRTGSCTRTGATAASCPAGRCTATRSRCTPAARRSPAARSTRTPPTERSSRRSAAVDLDHDGAPEVIAADMERQALRLGVRRHAALQARGEHRLLRQAAVAVRERAARPPLPHPARLPRLTGRGRPRRRRRRPRDRRRQHGPPRLRLGCRRHPRSAGFPVLAIDRSKITAIDPQTHAPTFAGGIGGDLNQGAIIDTPAVGRPHRRRQARDRGRHQRGVRGRAPTAALNVGSLNTASLALLAQAGSSSSPTAASTRSSRRASRAGRPWAARRAYLTGWPKKVGFIFAELLPVVGEGITGSPVIGDGQLRHQRRQRAEGRRDLGRRARLPLQPGRLLLLRPVERPGQRDADRLRRRDRQVRHALDPRGRPSRLRQLRRRHVLHGARGRRDPRARPGASTSTRAARTSRRPTTPSTGQFRPGFPSPVNDLSFLSGPSVGDLDGLPGEEVVGGTASLDLYGMNSAGAPFDPLGWPKLTGDWTVANPTIGSFGTQDTAIERAQGRRRA